MIKNMLAELKNLAALPEDAPMGLTGEFYTSQAFFEWECANILAKGWYCLGREDEITRSGDYFTTTVLGEPLVVIRNKAGEINVLSNVCRHRGMPVAQGMGNAKRLICSYHAWTYDHDGVLLRAARMENAGFDPKNCALPRITSEIWNGFIYANLSENPPSLASQLGDLADMLAPYEPENFRIIHRESEVWQVNWKCLVENFMEGYHLSVVHPKTLHEYTPTGLSRKGPSAAAFTSYFANYPDSATPRGMGGAGLGKEQRQRSSLFSIFPCQVASQAATLLVSLSLMPIAVNQVEVSWTMSTFGNDLDDDTLASRIALWQEVNREDREKLEAMQVALSSRYATSGPLAAADYEGTVRDFQTWMATQAAAI